MIKKKVLVFEFLRCFEYMPVQMGFKDLFQMSDVRFAEYTGSGLLSTSQAPTHEFPCKHNSRAWITTKVLAFKG